MEDKDKVADSFSFLLTVHVRGCGSMHTINSKVVPYSIISAGHGADPGFLAVSPQVT